MFEGSATRKVAFVKNNTLYISHDGPVITVIRCGKTCYLLTL